MLGRTLSHYRILEKIGAGGMGEVYRALDTKLGREVAIKMLPESMAQHPERIARLRREAQILAALNHPNIAAVYDLDECEGTYFLVLELVPGNNLAGPVPIREALSICGQIAGALEAAHQKGITHRDLKPANVKITPDGRVKLLDFGLARIGDGSGESGVGDATMTAEPTREGVILGTAAYMSPEQARGRPLDEQSDIWSFGCVLYETLTGRQLFTGSTFADIIAAILREDPKLEDLPDATPPNVRRLLERCLRQDLARRLKDIGDARLELEEVPPAPAIAGPAALRLRGLVWVLGGLLLAAAAFGGWWWGSRPRQTAAKAVHFQRITDFVGMEEFPAISPDGKTVAFASYTGGRRQIWIRLLAGGVPLQITKDDADHEHPRWAPDSSSLIYYSPAATPGEQGTIWEISALGGSPRRLASASGGGDISHDGRRIAFFHGQAGRTDLVLAAREGSDVRSLKQLQAEALYEYPRWSPDDRWIAFERYLMDTFDVGVWVISSRGGEPRQVSRSDFLKKGISWLPDGSGLVYASSAGSQLPYPPTLQLHVIGIDGGANRQLTFGDASYLQPDLHPSGKLLASRVRTQSDIWRFPVTGSPLENTRAAIRITQQTGEVQTPSASPDGKEVVYLSDSGGHGNLWVAKTDGSGIRQITFESHPDTLVGVPVWSPQENLIAFVVSRSGKAGQWLIRPDGSGLRQLVERGLWSYWSGDGRWLYYTLSRDGRFCIEKAPIDGGAPVVVRCDNALVPTVAPDGSVLYYLGLTRQEGGAFDYEVCKASPENGPPQVLARIPGARVPNDFLNFQLIVSPDGKWLAAPLADGATSNLWALPAGGGPMRQVTDFGGRSIIITRRISWSPDGKYLYAAVAETDADVVLLEGLLTSE